jgi:hypothetical protein
MGLQPVLAGWQQQVETLLPDLPKPPRLALATYSLAIGVANASTQPQVALAVPTAATVESSARRWRRWLASPRLDVAHLRQTIARHVLQQHGRQRLWLLLDETTQGHGTAPDRDGARLRVLTLRLAYRRRSVPLVWACHRSGEQAAPYPELIPQLLQEVAALLPPGAAVVLLADRGLCWPLLVDACRALGWDFLLRAQGQTRVQRPDGREQRLDTLVQRPGQQWCGAVQAFKTAGWRACQAVAVWRRSEADPWRLLTSLPAHARCCAAYRKRTWTEESYRDDKSHGFHWEQSQVTDPAHASRLLLFFQLAMLLVLATGAEVVRRGLRGLLTRRDRWELSLFTLGLRWLRRALVCGLPFAPTTSLYPT